MTDIEWQKAIEAFKAGQDTLALAHFEKAGSLSLVQFNIGMLHLQQPDYMAARAAFNQSVKLDSFFALGYFQEGYCHFQLKDYSQAALSFTICLQLLKDKRFELYEHLGGRYKLSKSEVLFNRSMSYAQQSSHTNAKQDFIQSLKYILNQQQELSITVRVKFRCFDKLFSVPFLILFGNPKQNFIKVNEETSVTTLKSLNAMGFLNIDKTVTTQDIDYDYTTGSRPRIVR